MFEQLYIDNEDEILMMMMKKLIMLRFMKYTSPLGLIAEQGNLYPLPNRIGLKAQCLAPKVPMFQMFYL